MKNKNITEDNSERKNKLQDIKLLIKLIIHLISFFGFVTIYLFLLFYLFFLHNYFTLATESIYIMISLTGIFIVIYAFSSDLSEDNSEENNKNE
jgi:hypothetical protein